MKIYNYDPQSGAFISEGVADESPLEPNKYLIPAYATTTAPPKFDETKQTCVFVNNEWVLADIPEPDPEPEEATDYVSVNEHNLWQAATDYEQSYISGSAVGTLTIGVIQGLPKSKEIKFWIENLWMNHYYPRKAAVPNDRALTKEELDFSLVGPMPYSVPELVAEVSM